MTVSIPTLTRLAKTATAVLLLCVAMTGAANFISQPTVSAASAHVNRCKKSFLGLEPWYKYMDQEFTSRYAPADARRDPCNIKCFNFFNQSVANDCGKKDSDVPGVILAIVDDLLRVAGLVAVAFVLVGAFQLVTSQGNAERTAKGRSTVINALIGLAMAMVAIAFISYVGNQLG